MTERSRSSDNHGGATFDAIERHPYDYPWRDRLVEIEALRQGEGETVYSATGEGAYWIVHDSGTLADFILHGESLVEKLGLRADTFEQDRNLLAQLIRLERYDDEARWEMAKKAVRRNTERPGA